MGVLGLRERPLAAILAAERVVAEVGRAMTPEPTKPRSNAGRPSRICPECGGDRWRAKEAQRAMEAAQRMVARAEELARENGLLRFKLAHATAEAQEHQGWLQRKIVRQARAIKRLEARLRSLGDRPHEDASFADTTTGAEFDSREA
jgi:hypothetical protein